MRWNWQQPDWPRFRWKREALQAMEEQFLIRGGGLLAFTRQLNDDDWQRVRVDAMSAEAVMTSEIEGELLNRASVQSSIQRQLGLKAESRRVAARERGIAELMVALYGTVGEELTQDVLFGWHRQVMAGGRTEAGVGAYRTSGEPMQVVSRALHVPKVHFEAPPSSAVRKEMDRYLAWFQRCGPNGAEPLPALTRAGTAHLYFESIHPFEDGNGRLGRAVAEKALMQGLGQPAVIGLARGILRRHREYYAELERANKRNEISGWLQWFAAVALDAQSATANDVDFLLEKTRLLDRLRGRINARQTKALLRMFREGPEGFAGGMSAGKYATITGASAATATRDLTELVDLAALSRTGKLRHTRYALNAASNAASKTAEARYPRRNP